MFKHPANKKYTRYVPLCARGLLTFIVVVIGDAGQRWRNRGDKGKILKRSDVCVGVQYTPHKMKFLLSLSALLGLAAASSSCEDCTHLVTTMATYLTSEESMARQVEVLLASVCPGTEDPDNCVAKLPEFWMAVGAVLWPGYYDPFAVWMCAKPDVCGAPEFKKRLSLK